jgi:hypothetical protein
VFAQSGIPLGRYFVRSQYDFTDLDQYLPANDIAYRRTLPRPKRRSRSRLCSASKVPQPASTSSSSPGYSNGPAMPTWPSTSTAATEGHLETRSTRCCPSRTPSWPRT